MRAEEAEAGGFVSSPLYLNSLRRDSGGQARPSDMPSERISQDSTCLNFALWTLVSFGTLGCARAPPARAPPCGD